MNIHDIGQGSANNQKRDSSKLFLIYDTLLLAVLLGVSTFVYNVSDGSYYGHMYFAVHLTFLVIITNVIIAFYWDGAYTALRRRVIIGLVVFQVPVLLCQDQLVELTLMSTAVAGQIIMYATNVRIQLEP